METYTRKANWNVLIFFHIFIRIRFICNIIIIIFLVWMLPHLSLLDAFHFSIQLNFIGSFFFCFCFLVLVLSVTFIACLLCVYLFVIRYRYFIIFLFLFFCFCLFLVLFLYITKLTQSKFVISDQSLHTHYVLN